MRLKYAAQNKGDCRWPRTEHGRQNFSSPRLGNRQQKPKAQHKTDSGDRKFSGPSRSWAMDTEVVA